MNRSELMAELDHRETLRRHGIYKAELVHLLARAKDYAEPTFQGPTRLARDKVVQAIEKLIREAEEADA